MMYKASDTLHASEILRNIKRENMLEGGFIHYRFNRFYGVNTLTIQHFNSQCEYMHTTIIRWVK